MIRVVLFDYGGVLTAGGTSGGLVRLVMNVMQIPYSEAVRARPLLGQLIRGEISTEKFLRALTEAYPDAPRPTKAALLKHAEVFTPSPEVYGLAAELRQYGIRTAILSNMFALSAAELKKRGLYDGFDPVILSCEAHMAKPDMAIYELALRMLGVPGEEVLFIDDQERFLVPADIAGMRTLKAETPAQIVADVRTQIFSQDGVRLP